MSDDLLAAVTAERYAEPTWFASPTRRPDDELICRHRLSECVREAEQVLWSPWPKWPFAPAVIKPDMDGEWVAGRAGVKVWRESA